MRRRNFLTGVGGVVVGLPFLETLGRRKAGGQVVGPPRRFVYSHYFNGTGRGNTFWPAGEPGDLSPGSFDASVPEHPKGVSCLAPLREYADRLLVLRGVHTAPGGYRIGGHVHGNVKRLTASRLWINEFGDDDIDPNSGVQTSDGISVDQEIAKQLNPSGREALTLQVGYTTDGSGGAVSYRGSNDPVFGEPHPYRAYERIVGLVEANADARAQVVLRRRSVIDLVREDLDSVRRLRLSQNDERALDLHLTSLRELENSLESEGLVIPLPEDRTAEMAAVQDEMVRRDEMLKTVGRMQMDVIAMAIASDYTRSATLQWSRSANHIQYRWDGMDFDNGHHSISHGASDNGFGAPISAWPDQMDRINDWYAEQFRYLLERLDAYEEPDGTVLDNSVVMWSNEVGRNHSCWDVPHVLAGSAGGYLRPGRYVNLSSLSLEELAQSTARGEPQYRAELAHDAPNNKLLTTILNAVGCRDSDGGPVRMFGVPNGSDDEREQLKPGEYDELKT